VRYLYSPHFLQYMKAIEKYPNCTLSITLVVMASGPVDNNTWRIFDFADVKRFAWDACREVAVNETYTEPWTFQEFLTVSKREAYKSHKKTTLDSFFNNNNIYRPFIEEIIKEVVYWGFFSKSNDATEMDEAIYLPTPRVEEFAEIFRDYHDGDIGNVESYGPRR
jgi:hypothetical protein